MSNFNVMAVSGPKTSISCAREGCSAHCEPVFSDVGAFMGVPAGWMVAAIKDLDGNGPYLIVACSKACAEAWTKSRGHGPVQ